MDATERMQKVYKRYIELATGIDLDDPSILSFDPSKVILSESHSEACLEAACNKEELDGEERVALGLILLGNSPMISKSQKDKFTMKPGAIIYGNLSNL